MKPAGRLALLLSLILGIAFALSGIARADHTEDHTHPFCAQGANGVEGGGGGTEFNDPHFSDTREVDEGQPVLVPNHLAANFGGDPADDEDGDGFVAVPVDEEVLNANGADGTNFHGGHGGGPGGGQGGSAFFGAGDGGCEPQVDDVDVVAPPRRFIPGKLPVTGTSTEQFALMGGVFLILGATFVFAPQIVRGVNRSIGRVFNVGRRKPQAPQPLEVAALDPISVPTQELNGSEGTGDLISKLKQEIDVAWSRVN